MIRDITIGQYYPAQSPIHKLDPRVKLFATLIYIIALFSYKGIAGVLFIVAALAAVIKISKVCFHYFVRLLNKDWNKTKRNRHHHGHFMYGHLEYL